MNLIFKKLTAYALVFISFEAAANDQLINLNMDLKRDELILNFQPDGKKSVVKFLSGHLKNYPKYSVEWTNKNYLADLNSDEIIESHFILHDETNRVEYLCKEEIYFRTVTYNYSFSKGKTYFAIKEPANKAANAYHYYSCESKFGKFDLPIKTNNYVANPRRVHP